MKKLIIFIIIISGCAIFSSCTTMMKSVPISPIHTQINLSMDNLEFLGEITGTATQSYVLGLPYGGKKYRIPNLVSPGAISVDTKRYTDRGYNNALFDALMSKPDADFVLPISTTIERKQMFLGREDLITVKGKAFKIKTSK